MRHKTELQACKMRLASYDRQLRQTQRWKFKSDEEHRANLRALWQRIAEDRRLLIELKGKF